MVLAVTRKAGERTWAGLALAALTVISVFLGAPSRQNSIEVCNWSLCVLSAARPVPSDVADSMGSEQMSPLFLIQEKLKCRDTESRVHAQVTETATQRGLLLVLLTIKFASLRLSTINVPN